MKKFLILCFLLGSVAGFAGKISLPGDARLLKSGNGYRYYFSKSMGFICWQSGKHAGYYLVSGAYYMTEYGDLLSSAEKQVLLDLYPDLDTDGDGYSDAREVIEGSDLNDSGSLPNITKLYDADGNEVGQRFDNTNTAQITNSDYKGYLYTKDDEGNSSLAGVCEPGKYRLIDLTSYPGFAQTYDSDGNIAGYNLTDSDGNTEFLYDGFSGGSVYNSDGSYSGGVRHTGDGTYYNGNSSSSSGNHSAVSSSETPTITPHDPVNDITAPVVKDTSYTEGQIDSITPMLNALSNVKTAVDALHLDNYSVQKAIRDSLEQFRQDNATLHQNKIANDYKRHNDRTEQLNDMHKTMAKGVDSINEKGADTNNKLDKINNDMNKNFNELLNVFNGDFSNAPFAIKVPSVPVWDTLKAKLTPDLSGSFGDSNSLITIPVEYGSCSWTISADINNADYSVSPLINFFRNFCRAGSYIIFSWVFVKSIFIFLNK